MAKAAVWIPASIGMGLLGAAIWAAIAYFTHFEIGWIAWIIGGMVGFGAAVASPNEASPPRGVIAAVIALASVFVGKLAAVHFLVNDEMPDTSVIAESIMQDRELPIMLFADEIINDRMDRGQNINWPAGSSMETAESQADYPADVWRQASTDWNALSPSEQNSYLSAHAAYVVGTIEYLSPTLTDYASLVFEDLGILDAVFGLLAVATAYAVGGQVNKG